MFVNYTLNAGDFHPAESAAALQADRSQPELGNAVVAFDVDVGRFYAISGIEEESVGAAAEHGGHAGRILRIGTRQRQGSDSPWVRTVRAETLRRHLADIGHRDNCGSNCTSRRLERREQNVDKGPSERGPAEMAFGPRRCWRAWHRTPLR